MKRRSVIGALAAGLFLPLLPAKSLANAARGGKRLILVELSGANDGLNTVIPFLNDRYNALRPTLAIPRQSIIGAQGGLGFHPSLRPLMKAFEQGDCAIVQGLGYPGRNQSHFESIAHWDTGSGPHLHRSTGWLTEDVLQRSQDTPIDAHGISLDGNLGPFASDRGIWLSIESLAAYRPAARNQPAQPNTALATPLAGIQAQYHALDRSLQRISGKLDRLQMGHNTVFDGDFGRQAEMAALLIEAGVSAPVLKLRLDGFDTHEFQAEHHANLLEDLGSTLAKLRERLIETGHWGDTIIMTYSEFGRRAKENGSFGTDHGAAAPHFVMGGAVQGGFWGLEPDLEKLSDDDLPFTTDYRALYEAVLSGWFGSTTNEFSPFRQPYLSGMFSS